MENNNPEAVTIGHSDSPEAVLRLALAALAASPRAEIDIVCEDGVVIHVQRSPRPALCAEPRKFDFDIPAPEPLASPPHRWERPRKQNRKAGGKHLRFAVRI